MRSRRVLVLAVILAGIGAFAASRAMRRPAANVPVVAQSAASVTASATSLMTRPAPTGSVRAGTPSMLHLDPHHTNRSPFRAPQKPHVAFTYDMGGPVAAVPIFANGLVIATSLSGRVAALDVSGAARWTTELGQRAYGSPLLVGDTIYLGIDGGKLVGMSAKSGVVKFRLEVDGDADTGAMPMSDGGIVFAAGHVVYAARSDGTVRWRYRVKRKVYGSPAVADDGTIVFGGQDDALTALHPDGSLAFRVELGADSDAAPAIADDGTIYAGSDAGEVLAIDPNGGRIRWRTSVGGFVRGPLSVRRDGAVLASTYGPSPAIVAIDPRAGDVLWKFPIRGTGAREFGIHGSPLEDENGTLVFGGQDDAVHALDPDGHERWRIVLGGDIDAALILADDGALYAGCEDGKLYSLRD